MAREPLTPEQRSARARTAAFARWKQYDTKAGTAPARAAFNAKFADAIREQFPDLPEPEVQRRAVCARREHMSRIGFQALKTRQQNAKRRASQQQRKQQEGGAE